MTKIAGSGSISQRQGSADPDLQQNVLDPQHCFKVMLMYFSNSTVCSYRLRMLHLFFMHVCCNQCCGADPDPGIRDGDSSDPA
jgi:hypothetical protein